VFLEGKGGGVFWDREASELEVRRANTSNLACIRGPGHQGLQLEASGSPATSASIKINHN